MDYKQGLTNGEGLPWQLSKRLCELNDWPLDSDNFYKSQREFREIIEHAWKAGEIQSRSTTTWKTNPCAGIFEDTYFMLGELEELLSKNLGYPVTVSFLSGRDKAVGDVGTGSHAETEPKERELTAWLRETWINEGKLGGTAFFTRLKKYETQTGSPIVEHYSAGKNAGFRWETSAGTTGRMTKKTIQSKVSIFKNKP